MDSRDPGRGRLQAPRLSLGLLLWHRRGQRQANLQTNVLKHTSDQGLASHTPTAPGAPCCPRVKPRPGPHAPLTCD